MKFISVAILALVMLQATSALRALKVNDDAACLTAAQSLVPDFMTVYNDVKSSDVLNAVLVLTTKVVPEVSAIAQGGTDCYVTAATEIAKEIAGEYVGQQCITDIEQFLQDVQSGNYTSAIGDLVNTVQACTAAQSFKLNAVDCNAELKALTDAVPTVVDHLKTQNFMALIGDLSSLKPHIDNIQANCYLPSDACTALETKLVNDLTTVISDVSSDSDKPTVEAHGVSISDSLYDWKHNCFKPTQ